jgi:predicted site-specific integrase-resolvase
MNRLSTREAAKRLGINYDTLAHYIAVGKVATPEIAKVGKRVIHLWTEAEIEHIRQLLPKIANGRKTRYKKKQSAVSNQQLAKTKKKTQARVPAPQKKK